MRTKILFTALIIAAGIFNANAQTQNQRIKQGVRSGELTKGEVKEIREDRKEIRRDIKLAKADGKITPAEKKIIKNEVRREKRKIYRKKHNNRDRD